MGIKRIVDTAFWTDGKVDEFSPEDKYFMLYLLTNPFTTQLGIYEISIKQVAFQLGYSTDAVKVLLDRFESKYDMIIWSKETSEIAIVNFLKYSVVKGGKPVADCIKKNIKAVKNTDLIKTVFSKVIMYENLNETVKAVIKEYFKENDIEIDNENDNENERTCNVSSTNRESSDFIDFPDYEEIKETVLSEKGKGKKICEWCGCKTSILHKHHYPIPKRAGGKKVVNICSNCHGEFHLEEKKDEKTEFYRTVIDYLNQKAGTNYRPTTAKTRQHINARRDEGFTEDDFKTVIDKKCSEWLGTEWEKFLRPETLFGTKFESYLNAKATKKQINTGMAVDVEDPLEGLF